MSRLFRRQSIAEFQPYLSAVRSVDFDFRKLYSKKRGTTFATIFPQEDSTSLTGPKMSVLIPQESGRSATVAKPGSTHFPAAQLTAWRILGWIGLAYLLMSVIDLALGWYPIKFGTPEWEFGTISATIAGLAIPTLSLYLILCSAVARERANVVKTVSIVMIVLAVFLAILFILYLTAVPLALKAVAANPVIHLGMKKAILKSLTLFLGYEALYIFAGTMGLRRRLL